MSNDTTIVLVHGALTDASVWNGVSSRLQGLGYTTNAPALLLRGLQSDAEYLASFLKTIPGPIVLVGHSYGGSVLSHPAIYDDRIHALVFVAAFSLDAGESTGELNGRYPGSKLGETAIVLRDYPGGKDLYLRPEQFHEVYAADLPAHTIGLMAAAQRPIEVNALGETFAGQPTWRRVPSWALISTADASLPAEAQRFMAKRAGSTAVEIDASHASPVSKPSAVADIIDAAVKGVSHTTKA